MSDARIPTLPEGHTKHGRPLLIAVVNESCTGCDTCVDFCPVDCIDDCAPGDVADHTSPPIRIREPECIGCQVCAKVCEELDVNAIDMVSVGEFERRFGTRASNPMEGEKTATAVA